jgi:hypothetical protein
VRSYSKHRLALYLPAAPPERHAGTAATNGARAGHLDDMSAHRPSDRTDHGPWAPHGAAWTARRSQVCIISYLSASCSQKQNGGAATTLLQLRTENAKGDVRTPAQSQRRHGDMGCATHGVAWTTAARLTRALGTRATVRSWGKYISKCDVAFTVNMPYPPHHNLERDSAAFRPAPSCGTSRNHGGEVTTANTMSSPIPTSRPTMPSSLPATSHPRPSMPPA